MTVHFELSSGVCGSQMLREVVDKTLHKHGISSQHKCFEACSQRLFDISKFYLKVCKNLSASRTLLSCL